MTSLNKPQQQAIETTEGRVLIIAGPGSGKTRVITHRIAHLIENKHVPPEHILGLTFTNKAALEMKQRAKKITKQAAKVTLCTFHSLCMTILRKDIDRLGYTTKFSLYDERDIRRLISQLAAHHGDVPSIEPIVEAIQHAKSRGFGAESIKDPLSSEIYKELKTTLRAYNAVDFDHLILLTVELLQNHPDVLEKYQKQFRYIMIDEYQDTNDIQFTLAELLTGKDGNLCVVGDDDQAIYSWRGAEIKHILNFKADHTIMLEQNYRSTKTILRAADRLISTNENRHAKHIFSTGSEGKSIEVFHAPNEVEEARAVVERLIHYKNQGYDWRDMAILYRTNVLARNFEMALLEAPWQCEGEWTRGIPYQMFGGTELYERSEIKDLMAYLRLIANSRDGEAILRIINTPRRGIASGTLDKVTSYNRREKIPLWRALLEPPKDLPARGKTAIDNFTQIIQTSKEDFATRPLHIALQNLIDRIDYKRAIAEEVKSEKMREFKWRNVCETIDALKSYETSSDNPSLSDFLATSLLNRNPVKDRHRPQSDDRVNLLTFHSSKGLEFPLCFLVGLEDHVLPHNKREGMQEIEEERRLFYVALTRAKQHLTLSMSRTRKRHGKDTPSNPSRFLFELPKDQLNMVPHKRITY